MKTQFAQWKTTPEVGADGWYYENFCEVCRNKFYSKRSDARFCSSRCRQFSHRQPERQRAAHAELQQMGRRAIRIAETYRGSQDMLDELAMLRESIDRALKQFDVIWEQNKLQV